MISLSSSERSSDIMRTVYTPPRFDTGHRSFLDESWMSNKTSSRGCFQARLSDAGLEARVANRSKLKFGPDTVYEEIERSASTR